MNARVPAEVFPPGEFLREELEARSWTQQELADILDRPPRLISELIAGKRAITPETAKGLGEAFGTSPDYWMNLESQYQLSKVTVPNDHVARKARLYTQFPVREMLRRGWVRTSESVEVLEQRFCEFFNIADVSSVPELSHAAKKTHGPSRINKWCQRTRRRSCSRPLKRYASSSCRLKRCDMRHASLPKRVCGWFSSNRLQGQRWTGRASGWTTPSPLSA